MLKLSISTFCSTMNLYMNIIISFSFYIQYLRTNIKCRRFIMTNYIDITLISVQKFPRILTVFFLQLLCCQNFKFQIENEHLKEKETHHPRKLYNQIAEMLQREISSTMKTRSLDRLFFSEYGWDYYFFFQIKVLYGSKIILIFYFCNAVHN